MLQIKNLISEKNNYKNLNNGLSGETYNENKVRFVTWRNDEKSQ